MVDKIIDAATVCFSRNGFHRTTIDDIAKEQNVSKGAIYYYFKNKSEVIYATIEKGVKAINACIDEEIRKDQPVTQLLLHIVGSYVSLTFKFPELIYITYGDATDGLEPDLVEKIKELQDSTIDIVAKHLEYGASINVVKNNIDFRLTSKGIVAMIYNMCMENVKHSKSMNEEELTHLIVSLLKTGLYVEDRSNKPDRITF